MFHRCAAVLATVRSLPDKSILLQLFGYNKEVTLQIFIGTDIGKVKPHGFYQACRVCVKNGSFSVEETYDGTNVIEMKLTPEQDMTAR